MLIAYAQPQPPPFLLCPDDRCRMSAARCSRAPPRAVPDRAGAGAFLAAAMTRERSSAAEESSTCQVPHAILWPRQTCTHSGNLATPRLVLLSSSGFLGDHEERS